jgi:hypothetical protein
MAAKNQFLQRFGDGARLGLTAAVAAFSLVLMAAPVLAQFGGRGGGMFDSFFGPYSGPRFSPGDRPSDFTRAPLPRKLETQPANSVLVLGDSMADWLAYGLEDALGDASDLGVVRKHRAGSGLVRYDPRNETQDWAHMAREAIAATKPKFIVMMVGLNDRQSIRERPLPSSPAASSGGTTPPPLVPQSGAADAERGPAGQPSIIAPEQAAKSSGGLYTYEFRTEEWAEYYSRRIDATVAALKSAGVPVFWVGLPSVRGPKSTSDMLYLNDLFRTRAEKAGVTYIDVWDGFVDENGRYVVQGPDFEGQIRRLRVSDGVHFTKAGARKLAHYVEREIRRVMTQGSQLVSLPATEPQLPAPSAAPGAPFARPLAGPVVPLTVSAAAGQDLFGGDSGPAPNPRAVTRVLVKGEAVAPPAGRSDDFRWPRRGIAAFGTDPVVATTTDPAPVAQAPAPAIAAAPAVDAKGNAKKTTGRGQSQPQARRNSTRSPSFPFAR